VLRYLKKGRPIKLAGSAQRKVIFVCDAIDTMLAVFIIVVSLNIRNGCCLVSSSSFATVVPRSSIAAKSSVGVPHMNMQSASSITDEAPGHKDDCFIGFDLGTSGARMSIIEHRVGDREEWEYVEVISESLSWDEGRLQNDNANDWYSAVQTLLARAASNNDANSGSNIMHRVKAICVSGTSASCLLVDRQTLDITRAPRMYNYDITSSSSTEATKRALDLMDKYIPQRHTARSATVSLAKLLLWNEESPLIVVDEDGTSSREVLCHQSDYISTMLMHEGLNTDSSSSPLVKTTSDWHNCLKLGYDVRNREYPNWLHELLKVGCGLSSETVLPTNVVSPGLPIGPISPIVAAKYGLSSNVMIVGGTTDSNAAFFAAAGGVSAEYGTAVTSLGSTLAIKMLSRTFVEDATMGVYSHRFPIFGLKSSDRFTDNDEEEEQEAWLVGGASNVGCAILRQEGFTNEELTALSAAIDPSIDSPLSYYPLIKRGERFPVADGTKEPILSPKPTSRMEYLHGILQGIGDVERDGFRVLGELGASPSMPHIVLSCGGGARNDVWTAMRERRLMAICNDRVEVIRATNTEASYGAALLAAASFTNKRKSNPIRQMITDSTV
jgi:xylulokinase